MEPGHLCLLNYGERPVLYHVRILLAATIQDNWVVLTPDMDTYEEQMSLLNADLEEFIYLGSNTNIPPNIPANRAYGFAPLDPGTLANHVANGRVMANVIRAGQGLGALAANPAVAAAAPPVAPVAPVAPPGVLGGGPGAVPAVAPGVVAAGAVVDSWVAIED